MDVNKIAEKVQRLLKINQTEEHDEFVVCNFKIKVMTNILHILC